MKLSSQVLKLKPGAVSMSRQVRNHFKIIIRLLTTMNFFQKGLVSARQMLVLILGTSPSFQMLISAFFYYSEY